MAGHDKEFVWPYYFAKRPLQAARLTLRAGDQFPLQDKTYIRGLGPAFGIKDADRKPFSELDYVEMVNVQSTEMAKSIRERGLNLQDAKKLVSQGARHG